MSIRLSTTNAQLKTTLSAALTIGTGEWVTSAWVRLVSDRNTDSMLWALVDVDPNATVSKRVWTDADGTTLYVDEDGGGTGGYAASISTWYFVVYQRASGTSSLRVFDDSSSTTPLFDNGGASDADNRTTLDTIIIGDIEPSSRVACDMEITSLKVQTGLTGGWSDPECRTESQYFAIQKAGGTERFAWRLEDTDADTNGLNELAGTGGNFAVIAGTVANGSTRPSQLEAAPSASTTLYFLDSAASGSNFGSIQFEGSAPSTATTATGWTVDTVATGNYALMTYGSERASSNFGSTAMPNAAPNNTTADCFRSSNVLSGDFATGVWTIAVPVIAVSAAAGQDGRVRVRLWRSTSATGASATEITSGAVAGTTVTDLTTGAEQVSTVTTSSITGFSMTAEYLFVQIAWEITGAAA